MPLAALMALPGHGLPTINFRADFFKPAIDTDLVAIATIRRAGRTICAADVDGLDDAQRLVGVGRGCYRIVRA